MALSLMQLRWPSFATYECAYSRLNCQLSMPLNARVLLLNLLLLATVDGENNRLAVLM
jgi:hypothetical protein